MKITRRDGVEQGFSETSINGRSFRYGEQIYRLHLGTEAQDPDPVIEMHEGAGNAPAYRGLRDGAADGVVEGQIQPRRREEWQMLALDPEERLAVGIAGELCCSTATSRFASSSTPRITSSSTGP